MEVVEGDVEEVVEVDDSFEEKTDDSSKGTRGGTITRIQYEVFVKYLRTNIKPNWAELKETDLIDDSAVSKYMHTKYGYGLTGRFLAWAKRMTVHESENKLFFKNTSKEILCREDFETAVREANKTITGRHYSFVVTLKKLRENYTMGKRRFGMSEDFVREVLMTCTNPECTCKKVKKLQRDDIAGKTLRATKSCSSLSDKRSVEQTPPKKEFPTNRAASNEKKRKVTIRGANPGSAQKPPVAYYALLDLASIRSKQLAVQNLSKKSSNMILANSQQDPSCLIGEPKVVQVPVANSAQAISRQTSSAILAHLSKCIPTISTDQKTGNKRPVYYKLYANPAAIKTLPSTYTSTLQTPSNESGPSIGQLSDAKGQHDVMVTSPAKVTEFPSGSRSSINPLDLFDSLSSFSLFADSPGGKTGIAETLNKKQNPNGPGSKSTKKSRLPSFNHPNPGKLPYPDMWYFHHDVHGETNRYKKLVNVINDMRIDLKQTFMGSKQATERLRKKMSVAESLVSQCKDITGSRIKIVTERDRARKLAAKKANEKPMERTECEGIVGEDAPGNTGSEVIVIEDNTDVNNKTFITLD